MRTCIDLDLSPGLSSLALGALVSSFVTFMLAYRMKSSVIIMANSLST
jgi:hypothetical protein